MSERQKPKSAKVDVSAVSERLFQRPTKSRQSMHPEEEVRATKVVTNEEMEHIISRLQTETKASSGGVPCKADPATAKDMISKPSADVKASSLRLNTAHTKSSKGGEPCRTPQPATLPGYGLKMFPAIDGLDTRFKGHKVNRKKVVADVTQRLSSATTRASRARLENHRILLYPERTLLFNDTERITQFQETGVVVKQKDMSTREKWYN